MNKNNLTDIGNSHYMVLSVFFVCVTIAALAFKNSNILYWYIVGVVMELIYKIPNPYNINKPNIDERDKGIIDERDRRFINDRERDRR